MATQRLIAVSSLGIAPSGSSSLTAYIAMLAEIHSLQRATVVRIWRDTNVHSLKPHIPLGRAPAGGSRRSTLSLQVASKQAQYLKIFRKVSKAKYAVHCIERLSMSISSTTAVQSATSAAQSDNADSVNILVLKKALDLQATAAMTLLQALPTPALATQGSVGTRVNTFA